MTAFDRRSALKGLGTVLALPFAARADEPKQKKDPYADGVLIDGEPPKPAAGSFTVAVLPDTQHYSERFPETYLAQTRWIVENRVARNMAAVIHLGDITNRNTAAEWRNAARAMHELDGKVPYFLNSGNHDYSDGGGCRDRKTGLNEFFPVAGFRGRPTFGGLYDREPNRMDNSYHTFSAGGRNFLVLCFEFGPRADVVRWAGEILARHASREAILITHAFIYHDDTRYDWKKYHTAQKWNPHSYAIAKATGDDVCDGEELWNALCAKHGNIILTLNGHVLGDGLGRVVSKTPTGREVPQVLVNFQMRPQGGDGWLRLLEFRADGKTIEVYDYSPTRRQRNESPQNRFAMTTSPVTNVGI